ncbi:uncharacterized protein SPAPADRAFT_60934 [Spathaspora passalidarum NRRL Y-27907]|uniref:DNA polymerase epsilon subunit D n=1 Tax=Spathaspora passalidarum (strain NRRL Y-27907 / 11-Y1) TaxID=619300 RepID=G3AKJ1_SPAPN|nr:uncharacterized protein SPAPADRAFT_60934 [Spathaspora passalidarum NRRL Y-27907]EGW33596.1 hypothetical protein SPAPADRAFT_60934 [Spathaspora passalidarum NRRL Y-27907]
MPPKGWRKNAEGQYPQPNKDTELISIDEILFPKSTIQKLAKTMIADDNMLLAKDSSLALQRSATVFVSHLLFHARAISKQNGRKTVSSQDMLAAVERAEFSGFIPEIKTRLANYEEMLSVKKQQRADKSASKDTDEPSAKKIKVDEGVTAPTEAESDDDVDEEIIEDEELPDEKVEDDVDEVEEDEEDDDATGNPIELLSKEEAELQGESHESTDEVEEEEEEEEEHSDVE